MKIPGPEEYAKNVASRKADLHKKNLGVVDSTVKDLADMLGMGSPVDKFVIRFHDLQYINMIAKKLLEAGWELQATGNNSCRGNWPMYRLLALDSETVE